VPWLPPLSQDKDIADVDQLYTLIVQPCNLLLQHGQRLREGMAYGNRRPQPPGLAQETLELPADKAGIAGLGVQQGEFALQANYKTIKQI
jgi:hypothetical protein